MQTRDEMRGGAVSGGVRSGGRILLSDDGSISVSDYVEMMASSLRPVYPLRIFTG